MPDAPARQLAAAEPAEAGFKGNRPKVPSPKPAAFNTPRNRAICGIPINRSPLYSLTP